VERLYKIDIQANNKGAFSIYGSQVTLLNALEEALKTGLFMVVGVVALPNEEEVKVMQEAMEKAQEAPEEAVSGGQDE